MAFTNKPFVWKNNGVTPPETLQNSGFIGGKKLPAPYVNAQWTATYKAIEELQQKAGEVKTVNNVQPDGNGNVLIPLPDVSKFYQKPTTGIPKTDLSADVQSSLTKAESALQSVTKSDVGLSNVDNTSDANKPISTAQQGALNLKANIASPTFTGTPKSTTAAVGTNTTQIATTAFVKTAVDNSATTINDSIATHKADNTAHGIGDKSTLKTTEKASIVGAMNELFTNVSNGKNLVGAAITGVDDSLVVPTDPTFQDLADLISDISVGAVGVATSSGSYTFTNDWGTTVNLPLLTVTGLGFSPKVVAISTRSTNSGYGTILFPTKINGPVISTNSDARVFCSPSSVLRLMGNATITSDGFSLPTTQPTNYTWYAFK